MRTFYHATNAENLDNILNNGIEARNIERLVYMTETEQDALKFMAFRFYPEVAVFKIKVPKKFEHNVIETFDHSYGFFKCRAFGYKGNIPLEMISSYQLYGRN